MLRKSIAFIDHYDSFSLNLIDWLQAGCAQLDIEVIEFDDEKRMNLLMHKMKPLVFSPGPKSPDEAHNSLRLLEMAMGQVPVLGVCLGHQMICRLLGGEVGRSVEPLHGLCREITCDDFISELGFPKKFKAAAYNSLEVQATSIDPGLIHGYCSNGTVQIVAKFLDTQWPTIGVQFHPESFLTDDLSDMREKWLSKVI